MWFLVGASPPEIGNEPTPNHYFYDKIKRGKILLRFLVLPGLGFIFVVGATSCHVVFSGGHILPCGF